MNWEALVNGIVSTLGVIGAVLFVAFFLGMCIFVHELGHFLVAKWRGLHIDAFSIGFKKIWGKKINGVEYRIGCLPLGGYVELPQVDTATDHPKAADGTELPLAKPLDRILTAAAGPISNIIFGLFLGCFVWWIGMPAETPKMHEFEVRSIAAESPEYEAGLRPGDRIVRLNGKHFYQTWPEFVTDILLTINEVTLDVKRNGDELKITYMPKVNPNVLAVEKTAIPFFLPRFPIELHPDADSPAARSGIRSGDRLLSIDGHDFDNHYQVQEYINVYGDHPLELKMRRHDGSEYVTSVTPQDEFDEMNFLTDYLIGVVFPPDSLQVMDLQKDFPAHLAGMLPGDKVVAVNGNVIKDFQQFRDAVASSMGEAMTIDCRRGDENISFTVTPKVVRPRTIGASFMIRVHPSPVAQFGALLEMTARSMRSIGVSVANRVGITKSQAHVSARNMSGPWGMATSLFRLVRVSLMTGLYFVVLICFALAIFNLLPLPVLDGGHIFFALIELVFRRPLPPVVIRYLSVIFVTLLILLMVFVTYIDVLRTFAKDGGRGNAAGDNPVESVPEASSAPAPAASVPAEQ